MREQCVNGVEDLGAVVFLAGHTVGVAESKGTVRRDHAEDDVLDWEDSGAVEDELLENESQALKTWRLLLSITRRRLR